MIYICLTKTTKPGEDVRLSAKAKFPLSISGAQLCFHEFTRSVWFVHIFYLCLFATVISNFLSYLFSIGSSYMCDWCLVFIMITVCTFAVLRATVSPFLKTNADYHHLVVWRAISSHTGAEHTSKMAVGCSLCN